MELHKDALLLPVPDMSQLRSQKRAVGYRHLPLNEQDVRFNEELIDIKTLGIAGQPYYSRPSRLVKDPIPGVPTEQRLRVSVAKTLAQINEGLRHPYFSEFFGGEVEIYVEEAFRPSWLQLRIRELFLAELVRKGMSQQEALIRRNDLIAEVTADTASPHKTGGAFDCVLRYRQATPYYVKDSAVWLGFEDADTSERINPDYYEDNKHIRTENDRLARRNRRAEYAIMTGKAFGFESGFTYNPTEVFHKDCGDLLWAFCTGQSAYYGAVEDKQN